MPQVALLLVLAFFAPLIAAPAQADDCVDYYPVSLNLIIDFSGSMDLDGGWRMAMAREAGLAIIDSLEATGRLERIGAIFFPYSHSSGIYEVVVAPGNAPLIRNWLSTRPADGFNTPLYVALTGGARHLTSLSGDDLRILVAITDGEDNFEVSLPTCPAGLRTCAVEALRANPGWNYLIFAGYLGDQGERELRSLAYDSWSDYELVSSNVAHQITARVLEQACRNRAPHARAEWGPNPLRLGVDGFTIRFDASASHDHGETAFSDLLFEWELRQPDGTVAFVHAGQGTTGAIFDRTFGIDDIGGWQVRLIVRDTSGAWGEFSGQFEVQASATPAEIQGSTAIKALERLSVASVHERDFSGEPLEFHWEQLQGPYVREGGRWTTRELAWTTTEDDITIHSNGDRYRSPWVFKLTVINSLRLQSEAEITVEVENLPVDAEIEGPARFSVTAGDSFSLTSVNNIDPDGGEITRNWHVIQYPNFEPEDRSMPIGLNASDEEYWQLDSTPGDAGTWIFELEIVDNEGEAATAEVIVDVFAPPVAALAGPEEPVGSESGIVILDGSDSYDPDSPCSPPDYCHVNLRGPVRDVTEGIVEWDWHLLDAPIQNRLSHPTGGLPESLGTIAEGPVLELPTGALPPGVWTFQLKVRDAEGQTDDDRVRVLVYDENTDPIAVVTPPRQYRLAADGSPYEAILLSAEGSHDPDNLATGGPWPGIEEYRWSVVSGPECELPSAGHEEIWELFPADVPIDSNCHGLWEFELTVVDDDRPVPGQASARTKVHLSTCDALLCLNFPDSSNRARVDPGEDVDVSILYHVDSVFASNLMATGGFVVALEILRAEDGAVVHQDSSINPVSSATQPIHSFLWRGQRGINSPRAGRYHVSLKLLDAAGNLQAEQYAENAIHVGTRMLDCADFWTAGFPDPRFGGTFPCIEYREPLNLHPAMYQLYYEPGWDLAHPDAGQILRLVAQSLRDSWDVYSTLGDQHPIIAVLSAAPHPDPDAENVLGIAFLRHPTPLEPCPFVIYPTDWAAEDIYHYRQLIAHEVAHCFQASNLPHIPPMRHQLWWVEGTAEFLSGLVYPHDRGEFGRAEDINFHISLYELTYPTVVLFQSLANHPAFGVAGVVRVMRHLSNPAADEQPAAFLASLPHMDDALYQFAVNWLREPPAGTGNPDTRLTMIRHTGGGFWPARNRHQPGGQPPAAGLEADQIVVSPRSARFITAGDQHLELHVRPFSIGLYLLSVQSGTHYRLRLDSAHPDIRYSLLNHRFEPHVVDDPADFRLHATCAEGFRFFYIVATAASGEPAEDLNLSFHVDREIDSACP